MIFLARACAKEGAKIRKKSKMCVILRILDDEKILWAGEFPGCIDAIKWNQNLQNLQNKGSPAQPCGSHGPLARCAT